MTVHLLAALAAAAAAGAPVTGSVVGPVVSVKGATFELTTTLSPTGASTVSLGKATTITEEESAPRGSLKKGACVSAFGTRSAKGVVTVRQLSLTPAVKGSCGNGRFGGGRPRGRRPPANRTRPPGGFTRPANVGFAFGLVTAVKGSTLTVKGFGGTTTVAVARTARLLRTARVGAAAIKTKLCAFVRGVSTDEGVTVKATTVALSQPRSGSCAAGFRVRRSKP